MIRATQVLCLLLLIVGVLVMPSASPAQISVGVAIHVGPPALPIYAQPICPGVGYIWTPGYWAYGPEGYFWVPGTWLMAPSVGLLWTPGYWGWGGGGYFWHAGYWGPHVGFYGGINYGFGYGGVGFVGGEWRGGVYHYNTAVANVNTTVIHNTYNTTVINNNTTVNRTSFNGGTGGVSAQPTAAEQAAEREPHTPATALQAQHQQAASSNRQLLASVNHGSPAIAASAKPGVFNGPGVTAAHPAAANANANRPGGSGNGGNGANANHAMAQTDRPPSSRTNGNTPTNTNSTNPNHPNTVQTNSAHPNTIQSNTAHTNTSHPNNQHPNNSHPHTDRPPQQSHPSEPHSGGGHGGGRGR